MEDGRKLELKELYAEWVERLVWSWVSEYEAWDDMFEDEELTEEEWRWIDMNLTVSGVIIEEK